VAIEEHFATQLTDEVSVSKAFFLHLIFGVCNYSSTASGPLDVCNANSTVACDKIPSQGKAFGNIMPNIRDAKDVVPYKFGTDFYVSSVGEAFRLPFISHKFGGRGDPFPTG
jgi:hypothetical protein